jgi:hypothetical protein
MKKSTLLALASLLFLCLAGSAQAQYNAKAINALHEKKPTSQYALICINNTLPYAVIYSYRWGSGQWSSNTVPAYGSYLHWWAYETQTPISPNFEIHFDSDFNDTNVYKNYNLERYQTSVLSCEQGRSYSFKWLVTGTSFELYDNNN